MTDKILIVGLTSAYWLIACYILWRLENKLKGQR